MTTSGKGSAFFICGTPSDKRGFEYAELGPDSLPGDPPSYLDRQLSTRKNVSYDIEIVSIGDAQAAVYCQSYPLNPNDSEINRGAFLAVGFVCTVTPSLHIATQCISHVAEIAASLRALLKPNNTLPKGFRLKEFKHECLDPALAERCSPLLRADLLLQATHRTGRFEHRDSLTFVDSDFPTDSSLLYTGDQALAIQALGKERERIAELAQTAIHAAALAAGEQKNWLEFQNSTRGELEAFAQRKEDFDAVLERLQEQSAAADRIAAHKIAVHKPAAHKRGTPGARTSQRARRPSHTTQQQQTRQAGKPQLARTRRNGTVTSWSVNGNVIRKLRANSALIGVIAVAVTLVSTFVYYRTHPAVTLEPVTNNAQTQQERVAIEVKPTFAEIELDIVQERAALDGPPQSNAIVVEQVVEQVVDQAD